MCPPILTAASGIVSGVGSLMQSGAKKAEYKAEAAAQRREAGVQQQIGQNQVVGQQREIDRVIGSNIAGNAANGIALTGSALDILTDTAREGDLDIQTIRWNAGQKVDKLKYGAKVSDMNARTVAKAAPFGFLSPILDSAVKISGSFAKAA
jgi:hypothetical protein